MDVFGSDGEKKENDFEGNAPKESQTRRWTKVEVFNTFYAITTRFTYIGRSIPVQLQHMHVLLGNFGKTNTRDVMVTKKFLGHVCLFKP